MPQGPPDETTYRKAVNQIRSKIENAESSRSVHIYSFNVPPEQLGVAHALLDKADRRKTMRVTYSDDHNFIVRYMPSPVHHLAPLNWDVLLFLALIKLTPEPHVSFPPGCMAFGKTTFHFGLKQKQADASIGPERSRFPSIVLEVGDSESFTQLKVDMKLWLAHTHEVKLVILFLIDPPIAANANTPRITVQLWRGVGPVHPLCSSTSQQRQARMIWEADWTHTATPFYVLLSDIFRDQVPAEYGNNDRVYLDIATWRKMVLENFEKF